MTKKLEIYQDRNPENNTANTIEVALPTAATLEIQIREGGRPKIVVTFAEEAKLTNQPTSSKKIDLHLDTEPATLHLGPYDRADIDVQHWTNATWLTDPKTMTVEQKRAAIRLPDNQVNISSQPDDNP